VSQGPSRTSLIEQYHSWGRPTDTFLVGAEFERHLLRANGQPVPYFGEGGVGWLLADLAKDGGWTSAFEGEHRIALYRDGASVTLEPGSQFELSTAPYATVAEVAAEAQVFNADIDRRIAGTDIHQVALGYTPFAAMDEIPWVPKGRYAIMRNYLAQTGALAHDMMKGTCATQASFDFADEADAAAKVRLAILLGPLTTAMFANSPIRQGVDSGYASFRGHVWTQTDPRRTGFPEAAASFSFERWVDYLLDVPMMFRKRRGAWEPAHGTTFRAWLADPTEPPTQDDWDLHLTSVFPEVRIKRTIEIRGADCVPLPLGMAFVALFKGLLYTPQALDRATELALRLSAHGDREARFAVACRDGLRGVVGGRPFAAWAADLLEIATATFAADDADFLAPLIAQVATGESPAHGLLRAWSSDPTPERLIALTRP
jgi:glutamate--cysteine ligase